MNRFKKTQLKKRSTYLDVLQVCRLCGIRNDFDQLIPIFFKENEFDDENLDKKILDCVGIVVLPEDKMPPSLCNLCHDKVNDFYEYRLMCNATDIQTRILLGLPPQLKPMERHVEEILPIDRPFSELGNKKGSVASTSAKGRVTFPDGSFLDTSDGDRSLKRSHDDELIDNLAPGQPKKFKKGPNGPLVNYKVCSLCLDEFQLQSDLDGHMIIKHIPIVPKYGCATCMEGFNTDIDLKDHQKWHKNTRAPYNCIKCSTKFTNFLLYSKHLIANACVPRPKFIVLKDIRCLKCSKPFLTQNLYEWHGCFIKTGKGCAKCGLRFSKKKSLFKHYIICDQPFTDEYLTQQPGLENRDGDIEAKYEIKTEDAGVEEDGALLEVATSKKSSLTILLPKKVAKKNKKSGETDGAGASKKAKPSSSEVEYNQLSSLLSSVNEAIAKITSVSSKKKKKKKSKELDIKIEPGTEEAGTGSLDGESTQEGSDCYNYGGDDWQADNDDNEDEDEDPTPLDTSLTDSGVPVTVASMKAAKMTVLPSAAMLQPVVSLGARVVKVELPDFPPMCDAQVLLEPVETSDAESDQPGASDIIEFDPDLARNIKKELGLQLQAAQKQNFAHSSLPTISIQSFRAGPASSKPSKPKTAKPKNPVIAKPKVKPPVPPATNEPSTVQFDPELARNIKKEKGLEQAKPTSPPKKQPAVLSKKIALTPSLKLKIKKERGMLKQTLQNQSMRSTPATSTEDREESVGSPAPSEASSTTEESTDQPVANETQVADLVKKMVFKNPAALALKIKKERAGMAKKKVAVQAVKKLPAGTPTIRIKQERFDPGYGDDYQADEPPDGEIAEGDENAEDEEENHEEPEDYLGLNPMSLIVQATAQSTPGGGEERTASDHVDEEASTEEQAAENDENAYPQPSAPIAAPMMLITQVTSGVQIPSHVEDDFDKDEEIQQEQLLQPMVSIPIISSVSSVSRKDMDRLPNSESQQIPCIPIISNVVSCASIADTSNGMTDESSSFNENGLDNRLGESAAVAEAPKKSKKKVVRNPFAEAFRKKQLEQQNSTNDNPSIDATVPEEANNLEEEVSNSQEDGYDGYDNFPPVPQNFPPAFVISTVESIGIPLPPEEDEPIDQGDEELDLDTLLNDKINEVNASGGTGPMTADIDIDLEKELLAEAGHPVDADLENEFLAHLN